MPNSTLSLLFFNTMKWRGFRDMTYFGRNFNRLFSVDGGDCATYGFERVEGFHSKVEQEASASKSDLVFVGSEKGRGPQIRAVYESLSLSGLSLDFTVVGLRDAPEGVDVERLSYRDVLSKELASRCILDVCISGQKALTLRAIEAIMYDKALVTNSQAVKESRFFDPKTMFVLDDWNDIEGLDIGAIPKADYGYSGEFSPLRLLERISGCE